MLLIHTDNQDNSNEGDFCYDEDSSDKSNNIIDNIDGDSPPITITMINYKYEYHDDD